MKSRVLQFAPAMRRQLTLAGRRSRLFSGEFQNLKTLHSFSFDPCLYLGFGVRALFLFLRATLTTISEENSQENLEYDASRPGYSSVCSTQLAVVLDISVVLKFHHNWSEVQVGCWSCSLGFMGPCILVSDLHSLRFRSKNCVLKLWDDTNAM
jgi:hypothetical protein